MSRISVDLGDLAGRPGRDVLAVAEDRDAVAQLEHLVEPVADEEDGHARRGEPAHLAEEPPPSWPDSAAVGSSMMRTRTSRDIALAISTACWPATVSCEATARGSTSTSSWPRISAPRVHVAPAHEPAPPAAAHEDVLRDRQVREHERLLQ